MLLMMGLLGLASCNNDDTYADQKERERDAIKAFMKRDVYITGIDGDTICHVGKINPISEQTFAAQGDSTSVEKNEYVLFAGTGVYMQIVRRGIGEPIAAGQQRQVICQFVEYNILGDSLQLQSEVNYWSPAPDIMNVSNTDGTIYATFNSTDYPAGALCSIYGEEVPTGWITPLKYIGLGRQMSEDQGIAKVRLIVPHSEGHSQAKASVYPCFYEIKYQQVAGQE